MKNMYIRFLDDDEHEDAKILLKNIKFKTGDHNSDTFFKALNMYYDHIKGGLIGKRKM